MFYAGLLFLLAAQFIEFPFPSKELGLEYIKWLGSCKICVEFVDYLVEETWLFGNQESVAKNICKTVSTLVQFVW